MESQTQEAGHSSEPAAGVRKPAGRAGAFWVVLGVGLLWFAMGAGDWWMRFHWFRWQDSWIIRPETVGEGLRSPVVYTNAAHRGGDLTGLAALPAFSAPYEESHPAAVMWVDEFGYRNKPPTAGRRYRIVTVGDSYMEDGELFETTFFSRLAAVSGIEVYNHAVTGRGSFEGLLRFLVSDRFRESPPRVLIWGIIEREIAGDYFAGMAGKLRTYGVGRTRTADKPRYDLGGLAPRSLRRSLPNTSAFAQLVARIWNVIRYYAFGNVHPYVVVPAGEIAGRKVLLYREAIDAMKWTPAFRNVDKVAWAIGQVDLLCRERGTRLVIVLIPDKEEVYREHIPASRFSPDEPLQPPCLDDLEHKLEQAGIKAVNLLEPFRQRAAEGALLFHSDDTHWDSEAIGLAAHAVWDRIAGEIGSAATP